MWLRYRLVNGDELACKWNIPCALLLLAVATYFALTEFVRFVPVGDQLVTDPLFHKPFQNWQEQGSGSILPGEGSIQIRNYVDGTHLIYQVIPIQRPGYYRVTFSGIARNITKNSEAASWSGAGVLLRYNKDTGEKKYGSPTTVPSNIPSVKNYQAISHIRGDVDSVDVVLWIHKSIGQFKIESIGFTELRETWQYVALKLLVVSVWMLVVIWAVALAVQTLSVLNFCATLGICSVALVGALMPETLVHLVIEKISILLPQFTVPTVECIECEDARNTENSAVRDTRSSQFFSDIGHFLVFASLGFLANFNGVRNGYLYVISLAVVFALITEVLQLLVVRRNPSLNDLLLDFLGVLAGFIVGFLCMLLAKTLLRYA